MEMPACSIRAAEEIVLPASKSVALRTMAVWFAVSAGEVISLPAKAVCGDTESFLQALQELSRALRGEVSVAHIHIEEGAAPLRFLLSMAASLPGVRSIVSLGPRLAERPQDSLLDALRGLGASVRPVAAANVLEIEGKSLVGGMVMVDTALSSQYASSLMVASLLWESRESRILPSATGDAPGRFTVSLPYLDMTAAVMRRFGAEVEVRPEGITVRPPSFPVFPAVAEIESDWSGAAFFLAAETVCRWHGLPFPAWRPASLLPYGESLQGDARAERLFGEVISGTGLFEASMKDVPDLVPPLVAALLLVGRSFRLCGVENLRHKESDRLEALREEFGRFGFRLETGSDTISCLCLPGSGRAFASGGKGSPVCCSAHGDHRIAMALSLLPLGGFAFRLDSPETVAKSFPDYWNEIEKFYRYAKIKNV